MSNAEENPQTTLDAALFALSLDRQGGLQAQLTEALRALVLTGAHAGCRLPASRALAAELSVSRMVVTNAYDQLTAEGYLTARQGAGTFVAADLPPLAPKPRRQEAPRAEPAALLPFQPGLPDARLFPHRLWARHLERAWARPDPGLLARSDLFGWAPLRQAIADHLSLWRGLDCRAEQVLVTGGAQDGFDILLHGLLPPGAGVALEDPGWPVLHDLMQRGGARPKPVRIDGGGLDPATLGPGLSAVVVTPSRHYPTGVAMPLARRLALLAWAEAEGALVVEDDYDSEFRYRGQPLPALAGLDGLKRVIYAGSFSKLLSPALRIGYLVLPEALIGPARDYLRPTGSRASLLPQPALASFMAEGAFATHLRRARRIYAQRQAALVAALAPLADVLDFGPEPSGMHLVARMAGDDRALVAGAKGLVLRALSAHALLPDPPRGLVLGYTAFDEGQLQAAAQRLAGLIRSP